MNNQEKLELEMMTRNMAQEDVDVLMSALNKLGVAPKTKRTIPKGQMKPYVLDLRFHCKCCKQVTIQLFNMSVAEDGAILVGKQMTDEEYLNTTLPITIERRTVLSCSLCEQYLLKLSLSEVVAKFLGYLRKGTL